MGSRVCVVIDAWKVINRLNHPLLRVSVSLSILVPEMRSRRVIFYQKHMIFLCCHRIKPIIKSIRRTINKNTMTILIMMRWSSTNQSWRLRRRQQQQRLPPRSAQYWQAIIHQWTMGNIVAHADTIAVVCISKSIANETTVSRAEWILPWWWIVSRRSYSRAGYQPARCRSMGLLSVNGSSCLQRSSESYSRKWTMGLGVAWGCPMFLSTLTARSTVSPDGLLRSNANVVDTRSNLRGHSMETTNGRTHEPFS